MAGEKGFAHASVRIHLDVRVRTLCMCNTSTINPFIHTRAPFILSHWCLTYLLVRAEAAQEEAAHWHLSRRLARLLDCHVLSRSRARSLCGCLRRLLGRSLGLVLGSDVLVRTHDADRFDAESRRLAAAAASRLLVDQEIRSNVLVVAESHASNSSGCRRCTSLLGRGPLVVWCNVFVRANDRVRWWWYCCTRASLTRGALVVGCYVLVRAESHANNTSTNGLGGCSSRTCSAGSGSGG